MFAHNKPDVLVVGAGPVGLFTALALSQRGVRVEVIDRESRTSTHSQALALHAASLRLLEEAGLLADVLEHSHRVRRVGIYDEKRRTAELRIGDLSEDHSFLAVVPQDALEDTLVRALARKGVKVQWSHAAFQIEPHEDHVDTTIDQLSLDTLGYSVQHTDWVVKKTRRGQVPYVVGADGHSSTVRQRLGIDFPVTGKPSDYAVFEFKTDADLGDEMRLCLRERTTDLCWPLPHGYCRWSFEVTQPGEDREPREKDCELVQTAATQDPELTVERLRALLAERAPWFTGSVGDIRWRKVVRFEQRLADSFGRGRVWLIGDACHVTGPAGIQSMNVGFREGAQLADALAAALANGNHGAELTEYAQSRRAEWRGLLGLDEVLRVTPKTAPWLAHRKDRLLACIPASGKDLLDLAAQLDFAGSLPGTAPRQTAAR